MIYARNRGQSKNISNLSQQAMKYVCIQTTKHGLTKIYRVSLCSVKYRMCRSPGVVQTAQVSLMCGLNDDSVAGRAHLSLLHSCPTVAY